MSMSRWWMLGAVLPLVVGCGGGSSSDDDRELFGVIFVPSAVVAEVGEDGVDVIEKVDDLCSSTSSVTQDGVTQDVTTTVDVGDSVTIAFQMKWINNKLGAQDVEFIGDGFQVRVSSIEDTGEFLEDIWSSYDDYFEDDAEKQHFETGVEGLEVAPESSEGTLYKCNNDNGRADETGEDALLPNPVVLIHTLDGSLVNSESFQSTITVPQSESIPNQDNDLWLASDLVFRSTVGTYLWRGITSSGEEASVDKLYEAEMRVTVCPVGDTCDDLVQTYRFRLRNKET